MEDISKRDYKLNITNKQKYILFCENFIIRN